MPAVAEKKPIAKTMPHEPKMGDEVFYWNYNPGGESIPVPAWIMGRGKTGLNLNVMQPGSVMSWIDNVHWIAADTVRQPGAKNDPKMGGFSFKDEVPEELLLV